MTATEDLTVLSARICSRSFDPILSYRLSYVIKNNRKSYYEAFEICENNFDQAI